MQRRPVPRRHADKGCYVPDRLVRYPAASPLQGLQSLNRGRLGTFAIRRLPVSIARRSSSVSMSTPQEVTSFTLQVTGSRTSFGVEHPPGRIAAEIAACLGRSRGKKLQMQGVQVLRHGGVLRCTSECPASHNAADATCYLAFSPIDVR